MTDSADKAGARFGLSTQICSLFSDGKSTYFCTRLRKLDVTELVQNSISNLFEGDAYSLIIVAAICGYRLDGRIITVILA